MMNTIASLMKEKAAAGVGSRYAEVLAEAAARGAANPYAESLKLKRYIPEPYTSLAERVKNPFSLFPESLRERLQSVYEPSAKIAERVKGLGFDNRITVASLMKDSPIGKRPEALDGLKGYLPEPYTSLAEQFKNPFHGVAKSISEQYAEVFEQTAGRRMMFDDRIKSNPLQQMAEKQSITAASFMTDWREQHEQAKRLMFGADWREQREQTKRLIFGADWREQREQTKRLIFGADWREQREQAKRLMFGADWREQREQTKRLIFGADWREQREQAKRLMFGDYIKAKSLVSQMAEYRSITAASFMANLHEQQKKAIEAAREDARDATMKQGFIRYTEQQEQESVEINIPLLPVMRALAGNPPPEPQTKLPTPQPQHTRQRKQQPAADPSDKQAIISAYMSEIGRKGNHSYGATKRQIIEHFIREHRETGISKNQFADRYHKHYNRSRSTVRDILKGVRV